MANPHFGRFGDVWKHLALGEALAIEAPARYVESHSGAASYRMDADAERAAFAGRLPRAAAASGLTRASYVRLLARELASEGAARYPGSPLLALAVLAGSNARFAFHDRDGDSLATIAQAARELGVAEERIELVQRDGLHALLAAREGAREALYFIDPFDPFAVEEGGAGVDAWSAFEELAARGVRVILWAGHHAAHACTRPGRHPRGAVLARARAALAELSPHDAWCGEVRAVLPEEQLPRERSLHGACLVAAHLSARTTGTLRELGIRLAHALSSESPAGGALGPLAYAELEASEGTGAAG